MKHAAMDIVLIEDSPHDVELTLRALRKTNVANPVVVARDGAEALDLLLPGPGAAPREPPVRPRVVLLDLKLPKVSGLQVLRELKSDERTRKIPVVVLTSSREEPDVAECYLLGVNSYIVKPVAFDAFARAVSDVGLYWLLLNEPPV
jgi:CheY-like chemotaxis protein